MKKQTFSVLQTKITCLFLHKTQHLISFLKSKLTRGLLDPMTTNASSYHCNIWNLSNWYWHTSSLPYFLSSRRLWIWKGCLQQNLDEIHIFCEWETARNSSYSINTCLENYTTNLIFSVLCKRNTTGINKDNCYLFSLETCTVWALWALIKTQSIYFPVEWEYLVPRCICHLLFGLTITK